ncbi:MAG: GGDEF domain-containing protein [Desulfobacteraceae bacterium]|nr:GGDEF domain-containing protein [Desulfobacteraceae bacterium]
MNAPVSIESLLDNCKKLPTLPAIALKLLAAIQKEETDLKEIHEILCTDPPLCAEVLKLVNSAFYSLPVKVTDIMNALTLLGVNTVKNLVLGFSLVKQFSTEDHIEFDYGQFWKDSLIAALASRLIMQQVNPELAEDAFLLGLLHDIGRLALNQCMHRQYALVLTESDAHQNACHQAEERILGFNHMAVGEALLRRWGLPESLCAPIGRHHEPGTLTDIDESLIPMIKVLHLSTLMIDLFSSKNKGRCLVRLETETQQYGFPNPIDYDEIGKNIEDQGKSIFPLFRLDSGISDEREQIMKAARDELANLNQKMIREQEAQLLKIRNLTEKTTRDGMTRLINYQFFHELLDREVERAYEDKNSLSLIIGDIDHFKAINDTYGHLAGDEAIKSVADCLTRSMKDAYYVARYGGEEFAIILFNTPLRSALLVAQTLRKRIESMNLHFEDNRFSLTMSFGVAAANDPDNRLSKEALISRADTALYKAKKDGRNRCYMWEKRKPGEKAV